MQEAVLKRNGEKIIQVRSEEGKLLFVKTKQGYEVKCPRSKKVYLISYKEMILEYLTLWDDDLVSSQEAGDQESRALNRKEGKM